MARILVVDDQKIPRATVAAMLEDGGHEVITAASGQEGLDEAHASSPDVIILDVQMPEMDGFAVVERLKRDPTTASIPVIFLTASIQSDDLIVRGLDLGAYDFLSKGCSKAELLARVGVMSRIKRGNDELTAIARIADALIRTLDPRDLSEHFVRHTREVFRGDRALFFLSRSDDLPPLRAVDGWDADDPLLEPLGESLIEWLRTRETEAEAVPASELRGPAGALVRREEIASIVATIVRRDGESEALLAVFAKRPHGFRRESDAALLHLLARQAMIAVDNALLHAQTHEQAEALARAMTERSRFFASMSHELRTPINAVIGYNQLLQEGTFGEVSPQQDKILNKISRSAGHLLELINDVLDISKIEAGKIEVHPEPTPLGALIRDTATSVQLQADEKGLRLGLSAPDDLVVETDSARLRQILLNLLSNAVKFTDEGEVRIEVERVPSAEDGRPVEIRVIDTGAGISPEDQVRIFEEFEQVGGVSGEGTGLGLAISRKLASLLGATLDIESEVGVGSTFTLRLPEKMAGEG